MGEDNDNINSFFKTPMTAFASTNISAEYDMHIDYIFTHGQAHDNYRVFVMDMGDLVGSVSHEDNKIGPSYDLGTAVGTPIVEYAATMACDALWLSGDDYHFGIYEYMLSEEIVTCEFNVFMMLANHIRERLMYEITLSGLPWEPVDSNGVFVFMGWEMYGLDQGLYKAHFLVKLRV